MSTRIPRLRFQIAQDDTERPADTQVLCRQQMGWVILLGAFLALLCIPAFRFTLLNQTRAAWTYRSPAWAQPSEPHRQRLARVLATVPEQPLLHLGTLNAGGLNTQGITNEALYGREHPTDAASRNDPLIRFYEGLVDRYPNEPAVVAACLRVYAQRVIKIARLDREPVPEPASAVNPHRLDPALLARVERYVARGREIDPENGFFPTMLGVAQIAAGEDEKALASFAAASRCPVWHDYAYLEGYGGRDLLIRAYGDHGLAMHVSPLFSLVLPHFSIIRQSAKVARGIADRKARAGDAAAEHAIRTDLIRLGTRMRTNSDTLIGRLVGNAIREIGFSAWQRDRQSKRGTEARRKELLDRFTAYARTVNQEAPHLSTEVEQLLVSYRDHPATDEISFYTEPSTRLLAAAQFREVVGLTLLQQSGVALLLWAAAALLAGLSGFLSRKFPAPAGARRWSEIPPLRRTLLLGVGFVPLLFGQLLGLFDLLGAVVLGLVALLCTHRFARGEALRWSPRQVTALTALALTLTTIGLLSIGPSIGENWGRVSLLTTFVADAVMPADGTWSAMFLPLPLSVGFLLLVTGLVRGASTTSLLHGIRVTTRALSALLTTAYLGVLLWTVPADRAATATFDKLIAEEIHGTMNR